MNNMIDQWLIKDPPFWSNLHFLEHQFVLMQACTSVSACLAFWLINFLYLSTSCSHTGTHLHMCVDPLPASVLWDSCICRCPAARSSRDCSLHCWHGSLPSLQKTTQWKGKDEAHPAVPWFNWIFTTLTGLSYKYPSTDVPLQLCPSLSITRPRPHSQWLEPLVFTHTSAQPPLFFSHSFTSKYRTHTTPGSDIIIRSVLF